MESCEWTLRKASMNLSNEMISSLVADLRLARNVDMEERS